ncbi:MAG: SDR family oxidoreductase [Salinivirgaceae bacterium]|nr:SDR family oxidoreductase [Salinivirgaceae bacterium]
MNSNNMFSIEGKVAVVTGGAGVLGGSIAQHLVEQGAKVAVLGRHKENTEAKVAELQALGKGEVMAVVSDVLDVEKLRATREELIAKWGKIDILVNCAGGNVPGATIPDDKSVFDMKIEDFEKVTTINMNGTVYPSIIFGEAMAKQGSGSIITISSMASFQAITRVLGYAIAKGGILNFTQWMAQEMAIKFGEKVRVNSIAPGFFIGNQNRALLINPDGSLTERSKKVLAHTPMRRFGDISELNGTVQFLCSDAASFITGAVIPVDGGFNSFTGV